MIKIIGYGAYAPTKILSNFDLEKLVNTSAASIPLILSEGVRSNKIKPSDKILMVGFGAGLSYGACLMEW